MIIKNGLKNKYSAFTLAEVLITLLIIGVIAAITIPIIMNEFQTVQQRTQFKKAFTTINNAIYKIKSNVGYYPNCFYGYNGGSASFTECNTLFFPELKKNLNIVQDCTNNAYANGCIPYYNDNAIGGCPGFSQNNMQNNATVYVLADGMIIILYYTGMGLFAVDINGQKPPNKWGYDLYTFDWQGNNDLIKIRGTGCYTPDTGGVSTATMIQNSLK